MKEARRSYVVALVAVLLALCLAPQVVRLLSVVRFYDLQVNTGIEGPNLYNIWRVLNHHPLYTSPWNPPFSLTLYNFGFYWTYASLARLFQVNDAGLLLMARMLTLAFAIFGAIVTYRLIRLALPHPARAAGFVALAVSLIAWLGLNSTVWWSISARPDMASCAFAMLGCYLYARHLSKTGTGNLLAAGLSFAVGWMFKQSTVWSATACFLFALLLSRKPKEALMLALPGVCILGVVAVVAPGAYWQNTVVAPALDAVLPGLVLRRGLEVLLPNLALFLVPVVVLAGGRMRRRLLTPGQGANAEVIRMLIFVAALTLAIGTIAAGREGASRNQLFEALFASAAVAAVCLVACMPRFGEQWELPQRWATALIACLLCSMMPLPLLTVAIPRLDEGRLHWHLVWMDTSSYARRQAMADALKSYPRPMLIKDEVLSLPWNSSNNRYPAAVSDWLWYELAHRRKLLHGGVESEIDAGRFATLVLTPEDPLVDVARGAGYRQVRQLDDAVTPMGQPERLVVWVR